MRPWKETGVRSPPHLVSLLEFVLQQSHLCLTLLSRQSKYSHLANGGFKIAFSWVELKGIVRKPFDFSLGVLKLLPPYLL